LANRPFQYQFSSRLLQPAQSLLAQVSQAMKLHQEGRLEEAGKIYAAVLKADPKQADALHYLGVIHYQTGRHEEATELIRQSIRLNRHQSGSHSNLGLALHALGRHQLAMDSYDRAIELDRRNADAVYNRGKLLLDMGRAEASLKDLTAALVLRPGFSKALDSLAKAYLRLGRLSEALDHANRAVGASASAAHFNSRGIVLQALNRLDEALADFDKATQLAPDLLDGWNNKAGVLRLMGLHREAVAALDEALRTAPDSADIRLKQAVSRLPIIRDESDDVAAIRARFAADLSAFEAWAVEHAVGDPFQVVGGCQPFYLAYQEADNRELLSAYGAVCTRLMSASTPAPELAQTQARASDKIRVGVVSAHFADHPVWNAFMRGWFTQIDKARFELHAFYLGVAQDAETVLAREMSSAFHSGPRPDAEWAKLIASSQLDILLYPELGMDSITPRLAAMRLARHQLASWGHPETTGLPTIDAYLSAADLEPADAERYYSERLVRLANLGCHYTPAEVEHVEVELQRKGPLFVCPGMPYKYAPEYDHVFADIAKQLGQCQFLFFTNARTSKLSERLMTRIGQAFRAAGFDPDAFIVQTPWRPRPEFYSILRQADVFLDTIGFSGFNTAMQAVECGLPMVTVEGKFMRGRFASAILRRLQLDELVQSSADGFVSMAVKLADDGGKSKAIRDAIALRRRSLYGDPAPVRDLEAFLSQLAQT